MRDLFVLAYAFAPCSVTGTYRTLAFVKYLEPVGWRSTVVCAENPIYPEHDERLLAEIPPETRVVRAPDIDLLRRLQWVSRRWQRSGAGTTSLGGPPTGGSNRGPWDSFKHAIAHRLRPIGRCPGWYRHALRTGRRHLQLNRSSAIFSSGPPWTAHLVAGKLAEEFALPWVADFRDPWVSNPFAHPDRSARRDAADEEAVLARADIVLCVLDSMRADFLARYPARHPEDVLTISNGFDPAILARLDRSGSDGVGAPGSPLRILHAGQVYGRRRIEPLLLGIQGWLAEEPEMTADLDLHLLGGDLVHANELRSRAGKAGAGSWLRIEPEIPHDAALQRMAAATVLLLLGFSGPGEQYQMSAKIFEYLAVRRPILALAPISSPVAEVLRSTGVRHWIASPDDPTAIQGALRQIAAAWRGGELENPEPASGLAPYDRRLQARQLAGILDILIERRPARNGKG